MPLPDYFSPLEGPNTPLAHHLDHRRSTALLLSPPRTEEVRSSLGFQFILGALPFTQLTLNQHQDEVLRELALKTLHRLGYAVVLGDTSDLPLLRELFVPRQITEPRFSHLSVNAYDALFLRIVSVEGEVLLSSPQSTEKIPFGKKWYRPFAFAPTIAYDLWDTVEAPLESASWRTMRPSPLRCSVPQSHLLLLTPPTIASPIAEQIGERLRSDTGYAALPPYSAEQGRRFVATELERGARASGVRAATLTTTVPPRNLCNHTVWWVESTVPEVQFNRTTHADSSRGEVGIMVGASFLIRDLRTGAVIKRTACRVRQENGSLARAFHRVIEASLEDSQGLCAPL